MMIGVCKYCAKEQPELNLSCINCNKREWEMDKKNVNVKSNIDKTMINKQKIEISVNNPILFSKSFTKKN